MNSPSGSASDDFTAIELTLPKDDGMSADLATARFIVTLRNSGSAAGNIRIWAPAIPAGFTVNISLDSGATFTQLTSTQPLTLPTPVDPGEERNIDVRLIRPKGTAINAVYDLVLRSDAAENPAASNQTICRTKLLPPMPMLTLEKRAVDIDGGVLHPGDIIEYSLILGNYSVQSGDACVCSRLSVCTEESVSSFFNWKGASPYMLHFMEVTTPEIAAVTHADKSALTRKSSLAAADFFQVGDGVGWNSINFPERPPPDRWNPRGELAPRGFFLSD